jgi:(Z)-2-((N-methylformamido)methylene)-5-hydroxybutyrolactone dehydrogenase
VVFNFIKEKIYMTVLKKYKQYIDGQFIDAVSGATYQSENPMIQKPWAEVPDSDARDVEKAVAAAKRAFTSGPWFEMVAQDRARLLRRLADLCVQHGQEIAALEVCDNGKLITEQGLQWKLMPELLYYWAGIADKIDGRAIADPLPFQVKGLPIPRCFAYTRREPVGVVGAIMPWNSPGGQLAYKFGPAMAAGCTMIAKPSEHSPVSALEFARLVHEAGFPPGVMNVVTGASRGLGAHLVEHRDVNKISFTGSTATGKTIVKSASDRMARVTCELGGKSANIIFNDADISTAVKGTMAGIFAATGQTCMAGSRVLVQSKIHDEFVKALTQAAESLKVGDPMDPATQVGPLANRPNFDKVRGYFDVARTEGVSCATGGKVSDLGGYFVEPTIYTGVRNDMRIAREEIFGPVASIIRFDTEDEAISIANDTDYGLAGAVFTSDIARAHRVAHRVRAGTIWINTYRLVTHLVPFGGYGQSGWGREGGADGLDAFLETKAIWVPIA